MQIALCTTTIHVPHALKLLRELWTGARFYVATDDNTPTEVYGFMQGIANASVFRDGSSKWKCAEAIGWKTLARRNIAFLEALNNGADIIYSWDTDNLPVSNGHFGTIHATLNDRFDGIGVSSKLGWFDPGSLLIPATRHRGIPYNGYVAKDAVPIVNVKVGVAAGLVIGDPDIDAVTRMEHHPDIGQVHLLGQTGVVVDPNTWTVFNSQNTAVIRELVPAWFMMPNVGRHDDIYASLIVQRVARERGYHVHFGQPFTYQQRHEHNLVTDLRAEIDGMEGVAELAALLDSIMLRGKSVIEDTRIIYEMLCHCDFIPEASAQAGLLWLQDCEGVI